nr:30S ribosomal protein S6 [Bifidobacterium gallicum]
MNNYEAVLIYKPEVSDEERNKSLEIFKGIIADNGEVESVDDWGKETCIRNQLYQRRILLYR